MSWQSKMLLIFLATAIPLAIYFNVALPMRVDDISRSAPMISAKDFEAYANTKKLVKLRLIAKAQALPGNNKAAFARIKRHIFGNKNGYKFYRNSPEVLQTTTLDFSVPVRISASEIDERFLNEPMTEGNATEIKKFVPDSWIDKSDEDASFQVYTLPADKPLTACGTLVKNDGGYMLIGHEEEGYHRGVLIAPVSPAVFESFLK